MKTMLHFLFAIVLILCIGVSITNAQLTGIKTIASSGGDYTSIAAAITALNTSGVGSGGVEFDVPDNWTETFGSPTAGNITATGTSGNPILFKKTGSGANPLITAGTGTGTSDYIIKINGVSYITFDGIDLQENGINSGATQLMEYGYYIANNATTGSQNNTIKNCTVTLSSSNTNVTYGVNQTNGNASALNSTNTYNNITVANCWYGIYLKGQATTVLDANCTVENCVVGSALSNNIGGGSADADVYGISGQYQTGLSIFGCEVRNATYSGTTARNAYAIYIRYGYGTINVYNNKLHDINNNSTVASTYAAGMYLSCNTASEVMKVYNNMVYAIGDGGGLTPGYTASTRIMGIYVNGVGVYNVYFNSVFITTTTSTYYYNNGCCYFTGSPTSVTMKNNILKNTYSNANVKSYCAYFNNGTVTASNYNNFDCAASGTVYTAGTGSSFSPASTDYQTLSNLQGATTGGGFVASMDPNSHQFPTDFLSTTAGSEDLHLNLSAVNTNYIGTPISGITTDIDGDTRNATYPYIGADENLTYVLPVELTSFTGSANGRNVELAWTTASEINNSGFEVQKNSNGSWAKIGFVDGAGTSNVAHSYSFSDVNSAASTYSYRLKQIDHDGRFTYSNAVEVTTTLSAKDFALSQNYPNPFNPSTKFSFAAKNAERTTLKIYNVVGQEVATLFSQVAQPNQIYTVTFDARNLPSGTYFYVLHSMSRDEVKKMMLMK